MRSRPADPVQHHAGLRVGPVLVIERRTRPSDSLWCFRRFLGRFGIGDWDTPAIGGDRGRSASIRDAWPLVLAAHSGGGVALRRVAQLLGDDGAYKDKLKACWGFDSIYGVKDKDADFWADWARGHPVTKVTMFYLFTQKDVGRDPRRPVGPGNPLDHREPSGTTGPALELERLSRARGLGNVAVERVAPAVSHNEVPRAHLADLLKAAAYLDDR